MFKVLRLRFKLIFLWLTFCAINLSLEAFSLEGLVQKFHPGLSELTSKIESTHLKLDSLPFIQVTNRSTQFGYHSNLFFEENHEHWVMIDLNSEHLINLIAIIPAFAQTGLFESHDYGFPTEFKIEVLSNNHKVNWSSIFQKPLEGLHGSPFLIHCPLNTNGRYVKITTLRHWKSMEHWATAFSEVMVFENKLNIAANCKVFSLNNHDLTLPGWHKSFLTDNQTPLGPPVFNQLSPSNGLLISKGKNKDDNDLYFILDLGETKLIDQIILYPSRPTDYADAPGSGFPRKYHLEGSTDQDFNNSITFHQTDLNDEINPGDNPVIINGKNKQVRFLKLSAQKLYDRPNRVSMSLSEIQVYSGGKNIALNQKVSTPYLHTFKNYPRWYPEALVDGYNSQFMLSPYITWLEGLSERRAFEIQEVSLQHHYQNKLSQIKTFLVSLIILITTLTLFILLYFYLKANRDKKLIQKRIREQISRDLHDEIGSQLGGIALLSETHLSDPNLPKDLKEDLQQISEVAYASGDSMKDIIWLISEEKRNLIEITHQFKVITKRMLGTTSYDIQENLNNGQNVILELEKSRHLTLFFKESLHNIIKHSKANRVFIKFNLDPATHQFELQIQDNGTGFIQTEILPGHGLVNLEKRAELIKAEFSLQSSPGNGTTIVLKIKCDE